MKTTILKYEKGQYANNYFSRLQLYDRLILYRLPIDNFPLFKEEYSMEDDVNILKSGFFDVTLSMLMDERSNLGVAPKDFFNDNYKYLIVCESGNSERTYSGIIDDMKFDYTESNNSYNINLSVYGFEKEFIEALKDVSVFPIPADFDFENEYLPHHFQSITTGPSLIQIESALNINTKINAPLNILKSHQNNFIRANEGFSCWDGFRSFLSGFQFRFRLMLSHFSGDYAHYNLKLFWRTEGINTTTIPSKFFAYIKSFQKGGSPWVLIAYTERSVTYLGKSAVQFTGFGPGA